MIIWTTGFKVVIRRTLRSLRKMFKMALEEYRRRQGQSHMSSNGPRACIPFSKEAFVDAILEFIVADDQVHLNSPDMINRWPISQFVSRLSMSLSVSNFGRFFSCYVKNCENQIFLIAQPSANMSKRFCLSTSEDLNMIWRYTFVSSSIWCALISFR